MPRKGGWRREGSRGRFRYADARGNRITDEDSLERIKSLVIPPAWKDVWISASASSKLQATGVDGAGRKPYLYYPSFRAEREREGEDFTAKDFRTWGGTLLAAIALAEHGPAESETEAKRAVTAVMRRVGEQLGNTPAVARGSYVSPAVINQYLDGTTIEDFRPRHLRVVGARDLGLDLEEQALLSLLRSWRIKQGQAAA